MKPSRIALMVVCTLAAAVVGTAAPAQTAQRWAPASKATIHPGVRTSAPTITPCTTNFVFYDAHAVYLGQEASCTGELGSLVDIEGATRRGTVVYNSRLTMWRLGQYGGESMNNFALVRIHKDDKGRVNPSVPFFGGPTGDGARSMFGSPVYSYGYSTDVNRLLPKFGIDTSSTLMQPYNFIFRDSGRSNGWTRYVHILTPGMDGDMGGAVLDARGRALGFVQSWAHDAATRVTDLRKAMAYMKANTSLDAIKLAKGTTSFAPPALPDAPVRIP